jgi:O-antigen/teichoic acid export membrane protein
LAVFLAEPILLVWLGNPTVAAGAAPILAILVVGMMLIACSYPALSILYSKNQLRPVIAVNLSSLIVLLPLMVWAALRFGVLGAAFCWGLFGLILFVSYRIYGLRGLSKEGVFVSSLRDFAIPCATAFALAGIVGHWLATLESKVAFVVLLILGLAFSWIATCLVCKDLRFILMEKMKWKKKAALSKTA